MLTKIKKYLSAKNWKQTDASAYELAYKKWGGSFILHPQIIETISEIAGVPLEYYSCSQEGELSAVVPVWGGETVAGNRKYLEKIDKKGEIDTGDNENTLSIKPGAIINLPFSARFISAKQAQQISNAKKETKFDVALARSHFVGENRLSRKFKYNQKRALRLFIEDGGSTVPIQTLSAEEICKAYIELFELRWGFEAPGKKHLLETIKKLHGYLIGSVLKKDERIIAIQLVFMMENTVEISAAYVNGGYNPEYKEHSPGSILCYLNTQEAESFAISKEKPIRYHFGKMDADYKQMWCESENSYKVD